MTAAHEALRAILEAREMARAHQFLAEEIYDQARVVLLGAKWHLEEARRQLEIAGGFAVAWAHATDAENAEGRMGIALEEQIRRALEEERAGG
jgi:signal transduction histidine kinase